MHNIREDPYVLCRRGALGHDWEEVTVRRKTQWGIPVDYLCARCGMVKHHLYDANLSLAASWYDQPDGYKAQGQTTEDNRREFLRRARAHQAEVRSQPSKKHRRLRAVS